MRCRHCCEDIIHIKHGDIDYWYHTGTQSIYCDPSARKVAEPR